MLLWCDVLATRRLLAEAEKAADGITERGNGFDVSIADRLIRRRRVAGDGFRHRRCFREYLWIHEGQPFNRWRSIGGDQWPLVSARMIAALALTTLPTRQRMPTTRRVVREDDCVEAPRAGV